MKIKEVQEGRRTIISKSIKDGDREINVTTIFTKEYLYFLEIEKEVKALREWAEWANLYMERPWSTGMLCQKEPPFPEPSKNLGDE